MRTADDALRSLHYFVWKALEDDVPPQWNSEERSWEIRLWGTEGEFGFPFARVAAITESGSSGSAAIREITRQFAIHLYPVPMATPEDSIIEVGRVEELLTLAFEAGFAYTEPLMPPWSIEARRVAGGLLPSDTYSYQVSAVNGSGESVAALATPVQVTLAADGSVRVLWTEAVDATSYNVYRTGSDEVTRLVAVGVVGTEWTDAGEAGTEVSPPEESTGLATVRTAPWRVPLYDYDGVPLDGVGAVSYRRRPSDFLRVANPAINRITDPEDDRFWLVTVQPRLTWRRRGRVPPPAPLVSAVKLGQTPA